jgi:protein-disulfide isomerase
MERRTTLTLPVSRRDHVQGSIAAPIVLVEYADFECPHCAHAALVMKGVQQQLGDRLLFVFRHFPLLEAHLHAQRATEAAEAAGRQNAFWQMHEQLFENQDALEDEDLLEYARACRLDLRRFSNELATQRHAVRVRKDLMSGVRSGVVEAPTFFIDGQRHEGAYDAPSLLAAIEAPRPVVPTRPRFRRVPAQRPPAP